MPTPTFPGRLSTSRAIIGAIQQAIETDNSEAWIARVYSEVLRSDQEVEDYAWIGETPKMREWIGGRQAVGLSESNYSLRNKHFEATIRIPVAWMRRDKTGQIRQRISGLSMANTEHWADLGAALIEAGESARCYDGQYFFDTDHPDPSTSDSATQSNDVTYDVTTPATPTAAEMSAAIIYAIKTLLALKSAKGRKLNAAARRFVLRVGLDLMAPAAAALGNTVIADTVSVTNTLITLGTLGGFQVELWVDPRATWTDRFALFRADGQNPALVRQEEQGLQIKAQAEGSPLEFDEDAHEYGLDAWRNGGYGFWESAVLVTLT